MKRRSWGRLKRVGVLLGAVRWEELRGAAVRDAGYESPGPRVKVPHRSCVAP